MNDRHSPFPVLHSSFAIRRSHFRLGQHAFKLRGIERAGEGLELNLVAEERGRRVRGRLIRVREVHGHAKHGAGGHSAGTSTVMYCLPEAVVPVALAMVTLDGRLSNTTVIGDAKVVELFVVVRRGGDVQAGVDAGRVGRLVVWPPTLTSVRLPCCRPVLRSSVIKRKGSKKRVMDDTLSLVVGAVGVVTTWPLRTRKWSAPGGGGQEVVADQGVGAAVNEGAGDEGAGQLKVGARVPVPLE